MARKILIFVLIIVLSLAAMSFFFKKDILSLWKESSQKINNDPSIGSIKRDVGVAKDRIFTSGSPLRKTTETQEKLGELTVDGVIKEVNNQRALINLPPLKKTDGLGKAADLKINDILSKQYFEHISPTGKGPADLAKMTNYDFIIIGENLALGNFKDDKELVDAWMASPGHRENILRPAYEEIGVSVRQGTFEGELTWIAVQEFGTPASACFGPDKILAQLIDNNKIEISKEEIMIDDKKKMIDDYKNKTEPAYITLVQEYNKLVETHNALVAETKSKVDQYNTEAGAYNSCLEKYSINN